VGLIELLIIVLLILWLLGYFGRGRFYATGPAISTARSGNWIHILLIVVLILLILRLLRLI
jgi:uncharacterized protein DUF5670